MLGQNLRGGHRNGFAVLIHRKAGGLQRTAVGNGCHHTPQRQRGSFQFPLPPSNFRKFAVEAEFSAAAAWFGIKPSALSKYFGVPVRPILGKMGAVLVEMIAAFARQTHSHCFVEGLHFGV